MIHKRSVSIAAGLAIAAALLAACGGSSKQTGATPTVGAPGSPAPAATVPPTPTVSADAQTAVALGAAVPLEDYVDPAGRYTVQLPKGWQRSGGGDLLFLNAADRSTLSIVCTKGGTMDQLTTQDQNANQNTKGSPPTYDAPNQVAGVPGRRVLWDNAALGRTMHHYAQYFEGAGCVWRVQLTVEIGKESLAPILDRVLNTFRFVG